MSDSAPSSATVELEQQLTLQTRAASSTDTAVAGAHACDAISRRFAALISIDQESGCNVRTDRHILMPATEAEAAVRQQMDDAIQKKSAELAGWKQKAESAQVCCAPQTQCTVISSIVQLQPCEELRFSYDSVATAVAGSGPAPPKGRWERGRQ